MDLTSYEEIVTNVSSPTLVLAGPGSGKTFLLCDRIKRLIDSGIDKGSITVLAFGVDASQSMKDKLLDPTGDFKLPYAKLPYISTMHSLGLTIVQEKPHEVNLLKTNMHVQADDSVKELMYRDAALLLGLSKSVGKIALECKQNGYCKDDESEKCKICNKYREIMSKCNYIDFDDQILFACQILENHPDILDKYQNKCAHLLVDEYQDINAAQFRLIELMSRKSRNGLFVVGDDAQSIYGFRGGHPGFILNFKKHYPESQKGDLPHCRRCHEKIMKDSFKILDKYYPEAMCPRELTYYREEGGEPFVWQFPSDIAEAERVAIICRNSIPKKKVLILAHKASLFPKLSEALTKFKVPHECPLDLLPPRIDILKDYLLWLKNTNDNFVTRIVLENLINTGIAKVPGSRPNSKTKPTTIENRVREETYIAQLWDSVDRKTTLYNSISNYGGPSISIPKIKGALNELEETFKTFNGENAGNFAKTLSIVSGAWLEPERLSSDILEVVDLLGSKRPTGAGSVEMKTMRKAKGLEADIVFIIGLENDIVPDPKADLKEQARLFYVSMTRAKENLYLFHSFKRPRNITYEKEMMKKPRSQFLDVLGRKSDFKPG